MTAEKKIVLITGSDKGIGFETAKELGEKGFYVILNARNQEKGEKAVSKLRKIDVSCDLTLFDVTKPEEILGAEKIFNSKYSHLDVLINNAGVAFDNHQKPSKLPVNDIRDEFEVNFFGMISVTQIFLNLLKQADHAKIINISSNMGSLGLATDPHSQFYNVNSLGYQASKASVNFATICFSKELINDGITVNSVNPGWTATEFGGRNLNQPVPDGMQTVKQAAAQIVKIASDSQNSLNCTFTENAGKLPW